MAELRGSHASVPAKIALTFVFAVILMVKTYEPPASVTWGPVVVDPFLRVMLWEATHDGSNDFSFPVISTLVPAGTLRGAFSERLLT